LEIARTICSRLCELFPDDAEGPLVSIFILSWNGNGSKVPAGLRALCPRDPQLSARAHGSAAPPLVYRRRNHDPDGGRSPTLWGPWQA